MGKSKSKSNKAKKSGGRKVGHDVGRGHNMKGTSHSSTLRRAYVAQATRKYRASKKKGVDESAPISKAPSTPKPRRQDEALEEPTSNDKFDRENPAQLRQLQRLARLKRINDAAIGGRRRGLQVTELAATGRAASPRARAGKRIAQAQMASTDASNVGMRVQAAFNDLRPHTQRGVEGGKGASKKPQADKQPTLHMRSDEASHAQQVLEAALATGAGNTCGTVISVSS